MATPAIVISTPRERNDLLEQRVRDRLPEHHVVRLRARQDLTFEILERIKPDFVFFPHWSWLIPEEIHSRFECVIFHMTDLPYGRDTTEAMQTGVCRGIVGAVRELIEGYATATNRWPQVVATGGGLELITPALNFVDTMVQHLSLRGIGLAYRKHLEVSGA